MATRTIVKKKAVKRLTPAQAKMAAKAMAHKGKLPMSKLKPSAKFTPPGFPAAEDGDEDD